MQPSFPARANNVPEWPGLDRGFAEKAEVEFGGLQQTHRVETLRSAARFANLAIVSLVGFCLAFKRQRRGWLQQFRRFSFSVRSMLIFFRSFLPGDVFCGPGTYDK